MELCSDEPLKHYNSQDTSRRALGFFDCLFNVLTSLNSFPDVLRLETAELSGGGMRLSPGRSCVSMLTRQLVARVSVSMVTDSFRWEPWTLALARWMMTDCGRTHRR